MSDLQFVALSSVRIDSISLLSVRLQFVPHLSVRLCVSSPGYYASALTFPTFILSVSPHCLHNFDYLPHSDYWKVQDDSCGASFILIIVVSFSCIVVHANLCKNM